MGQDVLGFEGKRTARKGPKQVPLPEAQPTIAPGRARRGSLAAEQTGVARSMPSPYTHKRFLRIITDPLRPPLLVGIGGGLAPGTIGQPLRREFAPGTFPQNVLANGRVGAKGLRRIPFKLLGLFDQVSRWLERTLSWRNSQRAQ